MLQNIDIKEKVSTQMKGLDQEYNIIYIKRFPEMHHHEISGLE